MNAVDTVAYHVLSFPSNLEKNFFKGKRRMYVLVGCMWTLVDTISNWGLDLQGVYISFRSVDAGRAVSVCNTPGSVLRTPRTIHRNPVHGISGVPWEGVSASLGRSQEFQHKQCSWRCSTARRDTQPLYVAFNHNWGENCFMLSSSLKTANIAK